MSISGSFNVLTLHQPWAWFVVHGFKQWETRSWRSEAFGPLLIHASKNSHRDCRELYYRVRALFGDRTFHPHHPPPFDELPRGCIVGHVYFRCCTNFSVRSAKPGLEAMLGDFSEGRWFWRMADPVAFEKPIPARGYQKLWKCHVSVGETPTVAVVTTALPAVSP